MAPLTLLFQESHNVAEGPTSPFSLEPGLIIWTWVVFGALLYLLWKYAWPLIVRLTEEREQTIQRNLEEARQANAEAKKRLEEHKELLAASKDHARDLVAEAKALGQKEREQLLAKTREEQGQMLERAKREIDAERERAVADLRREAIDLSLAAASKLIHERLESDADRKIVEDYLRSLEEKR